MVIQFQANISLSGARMTSYIVHGLFENQVERTASVERHGNASWEFFRFEIQLDVGATQHVAGKTAHAVYQVLKAVVPRVHGPDDIAHLRHNPPRDVGNVRKNLRSGSAPRQLTQNGDLRKTGAYVV